MNLFGTTHRLFFNNENIPIAASADISSQGLTREDDDVIQGKDNVFMKWTTEPGQERRHTSQDHAWVASCC